MLCFIVAPLLAIIAWEYFGMGLEWYGLSVAELISWGGTKKVLPEYTLWSIRVGPVELYRVK